MPSVSVRKRFVLGQGPNGTSGDVTLTLTLLSVPRIVRVEWAGGEIDPDLRDRVVAYTYSFLTSYVIAHPELGLSAAISDIGIDPVRQNEPERAINLALREAIKNLSLPLVPLYAAPEDDESHRRFFK